MKSLIGSWIAVFTCCLNLTLVGQIERGGLIVDETATRLNPNDGETVYTTALHNLAFDPQGNRIAVGQGTGQVHLFDVEKYELIDSFQAHQNWAFSVQFYAEGKRLVTGGGDNRIRFWDLDDTQQPTLEFNRHDGDVHSLLMTGDEETLISAGDDMVPMVHSLDREKMDDINNGEAYRVLDQHPRQIPAMDLSHNGRLLVTAARDGKLRVFELASGDLLFTLDAHEKDCITTRFIPETNNIISGGYDGSIAIWNANMGYLVYRYPSEDGAIVCVDASPDGQSLVAIDHQAVVFCSIENPQQPKRRLRPRIASDEQLSFARFHPDGRRVFVTTTLGRILVIDVEQGEVVKTLTAPESSEQSSRKK